MRSKSKKLAQQILRDFRINTPAQIAPLMTIISIAEYYNLHVIPANMSNCLARITINDDEDAVIRYNKRVLYEPLIKFSICHEMGHYFLHRDKMKHFQDSEESIIKSYKNKGVEREADDFASEMLMPTNMFINEIESSNIKYPDFTLVKYLSGEFNVSVSATAMKLVNIGIFCIALVASENNKIKWFNADSRFPFRINRVGSELNVNSCAAEYFSSGTGSSDPEIIMADCWVANASNNDMLQEHTFVLKNYGLVLSIIWKDGDII